MKVNGFAINVIKLATICALLINSVFSAALSDVESAEKTNNSNNDSTLSTATTLSAVQASTAVDVDYDNTSNEKASTSETILDTKPPLVFPSDESKNETALEILKKNSDATAKVESTESPSTAIPAKDAEVKIETNSTNNNNNDEETSQTQQENEQKTTESDYDSVPQEEIDENKDVENIQEDKKNQGFLEEQFGFNSTSINPFEEPKLHGGHIAVIFASSLILLSILAYVGLILWRNRLESRYGMRQRLVTEDDYYNNNDVRFFGL